jgi:hypothetical protein
MSSLALGVPLALCAVVLLQRACPSRPLAALAAGQFGVHVALALSSACAGAGGHSPHLLMTYAHVAAVVILRASWDRVALVLEDAVRAVGRHVPRLLLVVPTATPTAQLFAIADEPDATPLRLQHLPTPTGRRGPPAPTLSPMPA